MTKNRPNQAKMGQNDNFWKVISLTRGLIIELN